MTRMILAAMIAFLGSSVAHALTPVSGDYACSRINNGSLRVDCYAAASRGVDQYAAGACDRIQNSYDTVACIQTVAGRRFERSAIYACDRISTAQTTIECLRTIAGKRYTEREVQICDGISTAHETISCFQRLGSYNGGGPIYTPGPGAGNGNPPSVQGSLCYVKQTNEWVDGDRFFSLVNSWVQRNNRCAVAKIATVPFSGRIYDSNGRRVAKEQGGLSNSQVDDVLRSFGLYNCERFTCTETQF